MCMHVSMHHHTHTQIHTHGCIQVTLPARLCASQGQHDICMCVLCGPVQILCRNPFSRHFQPHLLSHFEVITVVLPCRVLFLSGCINFTACLAIFALNNSCLQSHKDPGCFIHFIYNISNHNYQINWCYYYFHFSGEETEAEVY